MKAVVCVKIIDGELNAFDACALESALRITEDVTVVSMCPPLAENRLKMLTRLGVRVIMLCDSAFAGSDTLATSYILSLAMKRLCPDIIFCGRQTTDGDTAQVGPCLATMLKMVPICNVMEVGKPENGEITCMTRLGSETQKLPTLLTIERICELRFPGLRSKIGEVEVWTNAELGADTARCGLNGSPTKVMRVFENQTGSRRCRFIEKEELMPLIERLRSEARKSEMIVPAEHKLGEVWAVGDAVIPAACAIAENVVKIDTFDPYKISEMAREKKPEVILWNADLTGRRCAPIAAALLNTGLCADCTKLETDGERLLMYRPARSGNVIAKIKCDSLPQMATVRCSSDNSEIIVSGGRGVADSLDRLRDFAEGLSAELCASRGLVDMGLMDYSAQIGLTGKNVSPKIYIAIGISGAVHHTCAIENAQTVIAINPDRRARIFDYADYGIVAEF